MLGRFVDLLINDFEEVARFFQFFVGDQTFELFDGLSDIRFKLKVA